MPSINSHKGRHFSVGIDHYPSETGFNHLRFASRDSECFVNGLFSEPNTEFVLSGSVTRSEFISKYVHWISNIEASSAVFYFAGHSFCNRRGTNLVFSDSVGGNALNATSLALSNLFEWASRASGRFIFFIDSCRQEFGQANVDFTPPNVTAIHATKLGRLRYEHPALTKSLPALLYSIIQSMNDEFLLSEFIRRVNRQAGKLGVEEFVQCSSCGDIVLRKDMFAPKDGWFSFQNIRSIYLIVDPSRSSLFSSDIEKVRRFSVTLRNKYNCYCEITTIEDVGGDLYQLEIRCSRDYIKIIVAATVMEFPEFFCGVRLSRKRDISDLISNGSVEELPGSTLAETLFRWGDCQFCAKGYEDDVLIYQIRGNTNLFITDGMIADMCLELGLI